MESNVGSQFRVETGGQQTCVLDSHDGTCPLTLGDLRQDFDLRSDAFHPGGANEYGRERLVTDGRNAQIGLEGVDLSAEASTLMAHLPMARTDFRTKSTSTSWAYSFNSERT